MVVQYMRHLSRHYRLQITLNLLTIELCHKEMLYTLQILDTVFTSKEANLLQASPQTSYMQVRLTISQYCKANLKEI